MARILNKIGQSKKALTILNKSKALSKKVDLPYLFSVEGDIYANSDQCDKAETAYRNALQEQPLLAGALLGLGKCLLNTNERLDLAISYIERATRLKPHLTEGFYLLGKAFEKTDPQKALRYYKRFNKRASADPEFTEELISVKKKIANWNSKKL